MLDQDMFDEAMRLMNRVHELRLDAAFQEETSVQTPADPNFLDDDPAWSLDCVNCGEPILEGSRALRNLYCDESCSQYAKCVRYTRRILSNGLPNDDQMVAIDKKLRFVYSSVGYPERDRRLPPQVRQEIFQRDQNICKLCGAPATEIDHILGSSSDSSNLRALCAQCNEKEMYRNMRIITEEDNPEEWQYVQEAREDVARRIAAVTPLRACDGVRWESEWRKILSNRKKYFEDLLPSYESEDEQDDGDDDLETIEHEIELAQRDD